jgi:hypothetical protein
MSDIRARMADLMTRLPEVQWDRLTRRDWIWVAFGWIDRPDGRSDFVQIMVTDDGHVGCATSSAEFSETLSERVHGHVSGHTPCERVEDVFGDAVANKIALRSREEQSQ